MKNDIIIIILSIIFCICNLICIIYFYINLIADKKTDEKSDEDLYYKAIAERIDYNRLDIEMMEKYDERIDHIEEEAINKELELLKRIDELNGYIEYLENKYEEANEHI